MTPSDRSSRLPPSLGDVRPDRPGHAPPPRHVHPHPIEPADERYRGSAPSYERPPEVRRSSARWLVHGFLVVVALITFGLAVLVAAPPVELVRSRIVAEVERQTGRKLAIGTAGVSFASGLGVSLGGITLSAPAAMGGAPLATAERMEVTLALLPLVFGEIQIDRLTLVRPALALRVDANGRRSWDFAALDGSPSEPIRYAQAAGRNTATDAARLPAEVREFARNASPPGGPAGAAFIGLEGLSLADVRIVSGKLRYEDARTGSARELTDIDATLSLPSFAGALSMAGEATIGGERMAFDLRLDQLRDLLAERTVPSRIKLDGKLLNASYDGRLAAGAQPTGEGRVLLKAASAAAAARFLGLPLIGLDGIGPASFDGQLRLTANALNVASAAFAIGATAGTGTLALETAGERPRLNTNLRFANLDLDQLAGIGVAPSGAIHPAAATAPTAQAPVSTPPRSIEDLIGQDAASQPATSPATRVHGFRKRAGNQWDVDAIEAAPLRLADVDARVQIASLKSGGLDASAVQAGVELKAGVLRLSVTEGRISGGSVRGLASIDARQPALIIGANLSGDSVALKPLLDAAGVELVDGRGRAIVAVSAQGSSERELVSTLTGRAELKVTDGALLGWDADAMVAGLAQGRMPETHRRPGARTPFKELSATFQITHGVARSKDLKLDSPSVAATGTGTINIVDRNLDLVLKPRVAAGGIEVPVRVAGSWDDPSVVADLNAALKSPQAQEAVKKLKDGNVEGALRSVLGNGPKADEKINKAKDALRNLLGR